MSKDNPFYYQKVSKYKYRNDRDRSRFTEILGYHIVSDYFMLEPNGLHTVLEDYLWNGSNFSIDYKSIEASCFHDCQCQMIAEGLIDPKYREYIDQFYRNILLENDLWEWHANFRYNMLRRFGGTNKKLISKPQDRLYKE